MYDSDSFKRTETVEPMLLSEILSEDPKELTKVLHRRKNQPFARLQWRPSSEPFLTPSLCSTFLSFWGSLHGQEEQKHWGRATIPHLPAGSSPRIRPDLEGREFKLYDKFEFWIELDIFIN